MKVPGCRLCGASHWSGEPHVVKGLAVRGEVKAVLGGPKRKRPVAAVKPEKAFTPDDLTKLVEADRRGWKDVEAKATVVAGCGHAVLPVVPEYCSNACRQAAYRTRKAEGGKA